MLSFRKLNDFIGWGVFFVAFVTYALSAEDTASFWDCGEFIAVSYKLMVPHPPGAPFFLLTGRMFSMLAMGDTTQIAYWVNMLSVLSSAFTILFLYWSIIFLAKKIYKTADSELTLAQKIGIIGAGVVGALAYTYSDSFWFSAAEAEVYGMSSFFTAFVVWAMLKWETIEDQAFENKWLLMISYTVGLSMGVHLLNLVTIPALALLFYFKKYKKHTWQGIALSLGAGLVIVGVIMVGVIPGLPEIAGKFEILFVNSFGLPFGSGALFFFLAFVGAVVYGIHYSLKQQNVILNTIMLGFAFVLIGYASYAIVLIRSSYNPPIDENDPENAMSFVSYLKREQYGDRPLLYGKTFASERAGSATQGAPIYARGKDKYEVVDHKIDVDYDKKVLLPRMYSTSENHIQLYQQWAKMPEGKAPTLVDNLYYMFRYQIGHMYLRYFLWNFAGRDGDDKEAAWLAPNAPSGNDLPEMVKRNKARDNYYMLPLILGLIGLVFQLRRSDKDFAFVGLLFVLLGVAIVVYLNSPPVEPRERDYIYVGSFYAFAMWIGFGVLGLVELLEKVIKNRNSIITPVMASVIGLGVPVMMGVKGWDNHDRSGRFHSVDQARNTLRSCAKNAILFTGGDNDTFPLWYVQDVEGFRTDVRVVVLSYFSTDWYINQMKRQVYDSKPLPITFEEEQYRQGTNDYLPFVENKQVGKAVDLKQWLNLVKTANPALQVELQGGGSTATIPAPFWVLPVDSVGVIKKGIIPKGKEKQVVNNMVIGLMEGAGAIYKSDLMILEMMANGNWDRPIYFNNTSANTTNIDIRRYLQVEGLAYRLVPMLIEGDDPQNEEPNPEVMYANLKEYEYRGFDNPDTYHDEEYRKFGANMRSLYILLARHYYVEGNNERAKELLNDCLVKIPDSTIPYDYYIPQMVELYYQLGEDKKATELADIVAKRSKENLEYIKKYNLNNFSYDHLLYRSLSTLQQLVMVYRRAEDRESKKGMIETLQIEDTELKMDSSATPSERQKFFKDKFKEYEEVFSNYRGKF